MRTTGDVERSHATAAAELRFGAVAEYDSGLPEWGSGELARFLDEVRMSEILRKRKGAVDVRHSKRTGRARLRFYEVALDQLSTIELALAQARVELDTPWDSVALEAICMTYLSTRSGAGGLNAAD